MKAICTIDVSQTSNVIGTTNTDLPENTITFNLALPLGTNSSYLTITDIAGTSIDTSILNMEDNEATYILDSTYFLSGAGTIKVVVHGNNDYTSNAISLLIEDTFTTSDNIFVETSGDTFVIKKIQESSSSGGGGGSGTGNYPDLTNLPKLNTTSSSSLATNAEEEIKGTVFLHKISKTGDYSDLNGTPTNISEFENDIGYMTSDDLNSEGYVKDTTEALINYYKKSEAYSKEEVDKIVADFVTGVINATDYDGSYENSDGFLVQWGRARVSVVAGAISEHVLYFPIPYESAPQVIPNPLTTVIGTHVIGTNVVSSTKDSVTINVYRANAVTTVVGYIAIGKKGGV